MVRTRPWTGKRLMTEQNQGGDDERKAKRQKGKKRATQHITQMLKLLIKQYQADIQRAIQNVHDDLRTSKLRVTCARLQQIATLCDGLKSDCDPYADTDTDADTDDSDGASDADTDATVTDAGDGA